MGMTLDESIDGKEKLESNGITAYVDTGLVGSLKQLASTIEVDFISNPNGQSGFSVRAVGGNNDACGGCPSAGPNCG